MAIPKDTGNDSGDAQRGQKKPFEFQDAYRLQGLLVEEKNLHYCCLFMVAVDSMLRCCDVIKLKVSNVRYASGRMRQELALKQKKSQHNVYPVLSPETQTICQQWIEQSGKDQTDYLFTGQKSLTKKTPIYHTTYRYHAKKWARLLGLDEEDYSTHSMRRIKPHYLYYACDVSIDEISELLGHQDTRTTRTYVGIDKKKAQQSALKHNLFSKAAQKRSHRSLKTRDPNDKIDRLNHKVDQLTRSVERLNRTVERLEPLVGMVPQVEKLIAYQNAFWSHYET